MKKVYSEPKLKITEFNVSDETSVTLLSKVTFSKHDASNGFTLNS